MSINFRHLDTSASAGVTGVRLVQRDGQTLLLLARKTQLSEAPVPNAAASGPLRFTAAGSLGGLPEWDAKPLQGHKGVYATVHVRAESAVSWAMFRAPDPPRDSRLHIESFAVYDHPRFAKGQQPDQWSVTALLYAHGESIPVVFPRGGISANDPPAVQVAKYSRPVRDARLVRVDNDFWLFLLSSEPGAIASPTARQLPSGDRMPAVLSAVHLDAALQPTSEPTRLFGAAAVYEFDADAAPGGRVVVFATTDQGALFAHATLQPSKPVPASAWQVSPLPAPLVSPSVLVNQGVAHVAAIVNLGTPQASVVYDSVPLQ